MWNILKKCVEKCALLILRRHEDEVTWRCKPIICSRSKKKKTSMCTHVYCNRERSVFFGIRSRTWTKSSYGTFVFLFALTQKKKIDHFFLAHFFPAPFLNQGKDHECSVCSVRFCFSINNSTKRKVFFLPRMTHYRLLECADFQPDCQTSLPRRSRLRSEWQWRRGFSNPRL